jgi:enediyne biosynthesis protein E4
VAALAGRGMGLVSGDFDDDGDCDVVVANDAAANFLFVNDGRGVFQERGVIAGLAYNGLGEALGNMGVECGDYDNDGLPDLVVTTYTGQLPVLYRNLGRGMFADATRRTRAGTKTFPHVKWGTALVDFDHDGDRDLFVANGHFLVDIHKTDKRTDYRVANTLCLNQGGQTFLDISDRCGSGLAVVQSSRGAAFDDLDNDGDVDGVVLNVGGLPTVLKNRSPAGGHWLQVLLRGVRSNRDGVGARVRVLAGGKTQAAWVHSGRGYQSHYGTRLHFGLGPQQRIERVEVRWPAGQSEVFRDLAADQLVLLTEGTGETTP